MNWEIRRKQIQENHARARKASFALIRRRSADSIIAEVKGDLRKRQIIRVCMGDRAYSVSITGTAKVTAHENGQYRQYVLNINNCKAFMFVDAIKVTT